MSYKKYLAGLTMTVASASALAMPTLDEVITGAPVPSLQSVGSEYFSLTDTDGNSDDFFATIVLEQAAYESNMGIYEFITNDDGSVTITDMLQIFTASDEPASAGNAYIAASQAVSFDLAQGVAFIEEDGVAGFSAGDSMNAIIDSTFGFYLNVVNTGHTYYSHTSLNSDGFDHLAVYETFGQGGVTNGYDLVLAWEDLHNGGDKDFTDMVVGVNDVAAVPEPGTLALLGLGLAGLGLARKRQARA